MYSTMRLKKVLLMLLLLLCTVSLWAVPARRISITVEQPDGTQLVLTMHGDEHFHCLVTSDGVPVVKQEGAYYYALMEVDGMESSGVLAHEADVRTDEEKAFLANLSDRNAAGAGRAAQARARRRAATAAEQPSEVPTRGKVYVPILLVQYADVKFSSLDPKAAFENRVNGEDYTDEGGYGSIREYFVDQSEGVFTPQFDIIGPVTLDENMEYYGGNDKAGFDLRPREMVSEACRKAYSTGGVDFSRYDNNGDGHVDILYVIYAGYGEASYPDMLENTIWPHQWNLVVPLKLGGVAVNRYACSNELDGYRGTTLDGIGTFCHEFSHCLGLPDFYDTSASPSGFGLKSWSLMDYGCYNNNGHTPCGYTGYEKDYLGWKDLIVLNEPSDIVLKPLSEGGSAYKIVNDANPNEYYVLENHKKSKWDSYVPGEGMLVLHVDYSEQAWYENTLNNNASHQRMTIIPADNKLTSGTLAGDVYPGSSGNTALTSESVPAAKVYAGGFMGKDITNISKKGDDVSLSFMKNALGVPHLNGAYDVTSTGFSISWKPVEGIHEYEVQLEVLEEGPYMLAEDFAKVTKTNSDIGGIMDEYTNQPGWYGKGIYGLDGAISIGQAKSSGYLYSPRISCDSPSYTIFFKVRKNKAATNDAYMVLGVGDKAWGNNLRGYGLTIQNTEWVADCVVMNTIGDDSFLYLDTRDDDATPTQEATCVDIDYLYILPGDHSKQADGFGVSGDVHRVVQQEKLAPLQVMGACQTTTRGVGDSSGRYHVTTIHTERTTATNFRFDNLDGGLYRASVRSVRGGAYSAYSNTVDVEIVNDQLPQLDLTIGVEIDNDSVYLAVNDAAATIYYTLNGTVPTAYSNKYSGPFELKEKATLNLMAQKEGYHRSEHCTYSNWFEQGGFTYRIQSTLSPKVVLSESMDGNDDSDYAGHIVIGDEVEADSLVYALGGIEDGAFRNATSLCSIIVESHAMDSIGDALFYGCSALNAVVWNIPLPITSSMFDETSYHNLLVYVPEAMAFSHPLIESARMTLVVDGTASSLQLDAKKPFYCPRSFVAEEVVYQRSFTQRTEVGTSAGWETIVLPFEVQRFTHSRKGDIAPFGVEAPYHFWLAGLGSRGFEQSTALCSNTPYIIAMPNNAEYGDYSLNGTVTFSASQATICTTDKVVVSKNRELTLMPTYENVAANTNIYALNIGSVYDGHEAGSVFVPNKYAVSPFSAYAIPTTGVKAMPYYRIQSHPEVEEQGASALSVESRDGNIYLSVSEAQTVVVYDVTGRVVCRVACEAGVNVVSSLDEGVYIIDKTKVYVRR